MKVVVRAGGLRHDADLRLDAAAVTVGELARCLQLAGDGDGRLAVDGLVAAGDLAVAEAGIHEGAELAPADEAAGGELDQSFHGLVEVCVVAGLGAGRRIGLGPGRHLVGRAAHCHVVLPESTVSREHCGLQVAEDGAVSIDPVNAAAAVYLDGVAVTGPVSLRATAVVEVGSVAFVVRPPVVGDQPAGTDRFRDVTAAGTINLNRPPRFALPPAPGELAAPRQPAKANAAPFSLAALVAPILMGVVMVVALGNALYALFVLLSPVMLVGNWWESKRRSGKALRRDTRQYETELAAFDDDLRRARAAAGERRRAVLPDLAEVLRRAEAPSVSLWQRRPDDDDFLALSAGIGDVVWDPPMAPAHDTPPEAVRERVSAARKVGSAPVAVDLSGGGVAGIVGDRDASLALARALLCQAAVHHGPADLQIAVTVSAGLGPAWQWAKWLPHTKDTRPSPTERRMLAEGPAQAVPLYDGLLADSPKRTADPHRPTGPVRLYVVDGDELLSGRNSPARAALRGDAGPAAGIVLASSPDRLPAVCTTVLTVDEWGGATLSEPRKGGEPLAVLAAGVDTQRARACAVTLARFEDPELRIAGASLPDLVALPTLLDLRAVDAEAIRARWEAARTGFHLRAPIGASEIGDFVLDFDRHGPHGLIGGTTGSGKSELLKTLVAGFAATYPPSELTFGLFDFKGGSTFVEFADLPHTVGMASDLDVSLARRALRCLRAELLHRERLFDRAGAKDLADYRSQRSTGGGDLPPVPRLVVIIDEFAAMASELAEEIGALTDLTARGRSLGVHLLLATQKPSTAVNSDIRTNTRLRISLQVEDDQDSVDVVGIAAGAAIRQKGRGLFRVGTTEVVPIQTALSSGTSAGGDAPAVAVGPFVFGPEPCPGDPRPASGAGQPAGANDLVRLVHAIREAAAADGGPPPRRPWPEPLPADLDLSRLADEVGGPRLAPDPAALWFALADDPDAQTRYPAGWSLAGGNLLVYGVVGSGTTTTLTSIGLAFASTRSPDDGHLYGLDFGSGGLAPLAGLPHCGGVLLATDRERHIRLLRQLRAELDRRRQLSVAEQAAEARILVLIDNIEAFRAEYEDVYGLGVMEQMLRLYNDGPDVGIHMAVSVARAGGVPGAVAAATPQKLIMRLADAAEYATFSISRREVPTFVAGRGILVDRGMVVQVARPAVGLGAAVAAIAKRSPGSVQPPRGVDILPEVVDAAQIPDTTTLTDEEWRLTVGLDEANLAPAHLVLYEHEHGTVVGPSRSGRSTALLAVAAAVRRADPGATILGVATRRSALRGQPVFDRVATTADDVAGVVDAALMANGPTLLVVDDAETVDDPMGRLEQALRASRPDLHVVIAGRPDILRGLYGHWTQTVRRSKAGILLAPNLDYDGDLLGAKLPTRLHVTLPLGRGFLVSDGQVGLVQIALPAPPQPSGGGDVAGHGAPGGGL